MLRDSTPVAGRAGAVGRSEGRCTIGRVRLPPGRPACHHLRPPSSFACCSARSPAARARRSACARSRPPRRPAGHALTPEPRRLRRRAAPGRSGERADRGGGLGRAEAAAGRRRPVADPGAHPEAWRHALPGRRGAPAQLHGVAVLVRSRAADRRLGHDARSAHDEEDRHDHAQRRRHPLPLPGSRSRSAPRERSGAAPGRSCDGGRPRAHLLAGTGADAADRPPRSLRRRLDLPPDPGGDRAPARRGRGAGAVRVGPARESATSPSARRGRRSRDKRSPTTCWSSSAPSSAGASVLDAGARIRAEPGVVGGHLNRLLAVHGRRIGPDPASIDAAMLGGILANNSSGMCCGVAQNSYHTLDGLVVLLADGAVVDTRAARRGHASCARAAARAPRGARGPARRDPARRGARGPGAPEVRDQEHERLQPERLPGLRAARPRSWPT